MDVSARLTSKGQLTIPKSVREALGLHAGDPVFFRVERHSAVLAKTPDFIELAGSVSVPVSKRGTDWSEVVQETRRARAERRR